MMKKMFILVLRAVINRNGIRNVVEIPLNDEEQSKFAHSAKTLKDIMAEAEELK